MAEAAFRTFALRVKPSGFNGSVPAQKGREEVGMELGNVEGADGM